MPVTAGLELSVVALETPDEVNVILGQSHFIKTVEDLHETLVEAVPGLRFGIAFCEASGARLVRRSGNDAGLVEMATRAAAEIAAGHAFVILLREGFPLNVLGRVKAVSEVCHVFCATANPVQVLIGATDAGRGILGVIDGAPPVGIETDADVSERMQLLRQLGYKV